MAGRWINRRDFPYPYQDASPFCPNAIVQVRNAYGDSRIGTSASFWWGYEREGSEIGEGVILLARQLDRPRASGKEG